MLQVKCRNMSIVGNLNHGTTDIGVGDLEMDIDLEFQKYW